MVLSDDPCKSWLLEKACQGLAVPESLCEVLLSEDQAQIDLSTFVKGGMSSRHTNKVSVPKSALTEWRSAGSGSALLIYLEQVPVFAPKPSAFSFRNASRQASAFAE